MNSYKGNKIKENALTKCNKCDCLIISDSSDSKNDVCINPDILKCSSKSCQTGESDPTTELGMTKKNSCFRMCRKKKKSKKDISLGTDQDGVNKTSKSDESILEPNINDFVKKVCTCKPAGGGCNTNTIIFPREKICGGGISQIENCIKAEARANTRHFEEILSELYKQKREIREIRDLLDLMVRTTREQIADSKNHKNYQDVFEEFCKRTCLERKSNTLSIVQDKPGPAEAGLNEGPNDNPGEQPKRKKKGLFSCLG